METKVYTIHKGLNRSLEFKGIKAQYILWLGGGLVGLLILFALLHALGLPAYLCLAIVVPAGGGLWVLAQRISRQYGEYGWMKHMARRRIPKALRIRERKVFYFERTQNDRYE